MDFKKIAVGKQGLSETVVKYLNRLTKVFEANSGIQGPFNLDNNMTPWEVHPSDKFIAGMHKDIQDHVRTHCAD